MRLWNRFSSETELIKPQFRRTIKNSLMVEGIGLHSGEKMRIVFHPAEENTGITFFRKEFSFTLPATVDFVIDTSLAVTLGSNGFYIQTVEHLMYAIFAGVVKFLFLMVLRKNLLKYLKHASFMNIPLKYYLFILLSQ